MLNQQSKSTNIVILLLNQRRHTIKEESSRNADDDKDDSDPFVTKMVAVDAGDIQLHGCVVVKDQRDDICHPAEKSQCYTGPIGDEKSKTETIS